MAIAYRSVSARLKADTAVSGNIQTVPLPPGHASGDLLLMFILTDGNSNAAYPPGWSAVDYYTNGTSTSSPYTAHMQLKILYRIDNGALGSGVSLSFNLAPWPTGNPYVLAFTAAYTGCDPTGPLEQHSAYATTGTGTAFVAPQLTTTNANDWLLTYRSVSSDSPAATFTCSVGTDAERVDDSDGFNELACALYDSNAALAAGTQTQRTTTASRAATYGSLSVSIALKPLVIPATYAVPPEASGSVTAFQPLVQAVNGGWDLCGTEGLPSYRFTIDWDGLPGALNTNPDFEDEGGWTAFNGAVFARSQNRAHRGVWSGLMTTGGAADPHVEADKAPVGAGRLYRASGWVWAESAFPAGIGFSVNWYDASGGYLSTSVSFFTPSVGAWQYAENVFTAPAGAALAGILLNSGDTPAAGLRLWIDEVRLDDWSALNDPSSVVGAGEDVTGDIISDISLTYGRDQQRQLNPAAVGSASFTLNNTSRRYSPENTVSPLFDDLDPARVMTGTVTFNDQTYPLFRGRIDDFTIKADFSDRTVDFTFLDGLNDLSSVKISTGVYASLRTGDLISRVLDVAGWTGGRDIDRGATLVKYWWADNTDALSAIADLVKSEGPPAVAYVAPDNTFVFRDRHHRLQRQASLTPRAVFHAGVLGGCEPSTVPQGALSLARPFVYSHGWRDIINTVTFDVPEREPAGSIQQVWKDDSTRALQAGQSVDIDISVSDPFIDAVTPVAGADITRSGPGFLVAVLNRDSGASVKLTLLALGGSVTVSSIQLRARPLPVAQTSRVSLTDPESVARHGERSYPDSVPWAGAEDAAAIANLVLLHYAHRLPTVQIRLVSSDPSHFVQVLQRTISDRVRIVNDEMGLDTDFFVERVTHTIQRTGREGAAPVHAVVLGCEMDQPTSANPFTFDKRGAGFDSGVFDTIQADNPAAVFVFDDPVQGVFDTGLYGT